MKTAEEILEKEINCTVITNKMWDDIIYAMEKYAEQFKPTAEADANTVLDGVANYDWNKDICPKCGQHTIESHTIYDCSCGIKIRKCGKCNTLYEFKRQ